MSRRYPHWVVKWNQAKTLGLVWRVRDWVGRPQAPVVEGLMRRGGARLTLREAQAQVAQVARA